mgnify:CR=1 FL=1
MKKIFQILLLVCAGLFLNSCYYDKFSDEIIVVVPDIPDSQVIHFTADIQPIFTSKCIGCHDSSNKINMTVGNSYNQLVPNYVIAGNADNSILYNNLPGKNHPIQVSASNEPSIDQLALLKAWIYQGAKNN